MRVVSPMGTARHGHRVVTCTWASGKLARWTALGSTTRLLIETCTRALTCPESRKKHVATALIGKRVEIFTCYVGEWEDGTDHGYEAYVTRVLKRLSGPMVWGQNAWSWHIIAIIEGNLPSDGVIQGLDLGSHSTPLRPALGANYEIPRGCQLVWLPRIEGGHCLATRLIASANVNRHHRRRHHRHRRRHPLHHRRHHRRWCGWRSGLWVPLS